MKHAVIHCNTLQQTAALYNKLQHAAIYCNILQYTATHAILKQQAMKHYTTPPHAATRCNTLQRTLSWNGRQWHSARNCKYCNTFLRSSHLRVVTLGIFLKFSKVTSLLDLLHKDNYRSDIWGFLGSHPRCMVLAISSEFSKFSSLQGGVESQNALSL